MRLLPPVVPTAEQLQLIGDEKPGYRLIRGAAGSGKTTTALLCLRQLIGARLSRRMRQHRQEPVRVLVLTFNRTLQGYIDALARRAAPESDALELTVSTFSRWARSLTGAGDILGGDESSRLLQPHLQAFSTSRQHEFFVDEVHYILGRFAYSCRRFEPESLSDYLGIRRAGRGSSPPVTRPTRERLIREVIPAYMEEKRKRGKIDWSDLAVLAADAESDLLYDVVVVDEAQDFSANQVRAILGHLQIGHSTTFVLDAIQRIYPQFFRWSEVGIGVRPETSYRLKENHRNTAAIATFASPLVDGLPLEDDGTLPDFLSCSRPGKKPRVVEGKYSAQVAVMLDRLERTADLRKESAALLQPRGGRWFDEARRQLRLRGIPYCELTRQNEWPTGPEQFALCTIHSAKGLEFDHVLLPGLSQKATPHGPDEGDADLERLRRMLAMAVGRARRSVMVGYKPGEESSLIRLLDPATYKLIKA